MKTTVREFGSNVTRFIRLVLAACLVALPLGTAFAAVTVTLTAPTNGAVFTAGSNITLSATASATQGYTISKVEFFQGGTNLIGTDTSTPYSISWNNVPAGSYTLTAKATAVKKNNPNQEATSSPVTITVNALPSVSITSPSGGAVFAAPGSMTLTANASDSDGSIQKVEFYHGGTNLIATITASPYTYNWTNVATGSYSLTAKATDNLNGATMSSPVAVAVTDAPAVSLTSPTNNSSYSAPASVTLTAAATDSDGSIQKVEFFHGGTNLIATVTTPPYTYNWTNVGAGSYSLTAKATDNLGIGTTSAPSNITVTGVAPAGLYFIHPDHLNTPRQIYNDQQQLAWRWDQSEPFGVSPPDENPAGVGTFEFPLRFPGQYMDKETNVHYNYFRDYDPGLGRYIESDPIGLRGGINIYAYVEQDPIRTADSAGLKPYIFRVTVGGAVSRPGFVGQVFNLEVTDPIAGQRCNYTVSCFGIGWSYRETPSINIGAPHVTWDDGKECGNCRQFEGTGWAGNIAVQIGPFGYTPVDWIEVPNGPRLDFSGWSPATISIGGGTFYCRFSL